MAYRLHVFGGSGCLVAGVLSLIITVIYITVFLYVFQSQYDEFQLWIIGRQVGGASTEDQLKSAWKKLESKNLQPDEYLLNLLKSKCDELGLTQTDIAGSSVSESAGG